MIRLFESFKFTDRKHPEAGIMSALLGLIGVVSVLIALFSPYITKAENYEKYALVMCLAMLYAIIGIVLAIIGKTRRAAFGLFPMVGLCLNIVVIVLDIVIIAIGA